MLAVTLAGEGRRVQRISDTLHAPVEVFMQLLRLLGAHTPVAVQAQQQLVALPLQRAGQASRRLSLRHLPPFKRKADIRKRQLQLKKCLTKLAF